MTKKLFLTALAIVLIFAFTSCGKKEEGITDGTYTINVTLSGGSGKATIESPAKLVVSGDTMTATVVWSSSHYEYMEIDGVRYDRITPEGQSTFEIPVILDTDMAVKGCTTAMSEPKVIDYVLHFDSASMKAENK
ncbi:MAG: hypothetical protein IKT01_06530 [Eubacteriaceae bacterium]|nr:hypothetical protein [Eubacteriaceae bacterium]